MNLNDFERRIVIAIRESESNARESMTFGELFNLYYELHAIPRTKRPDNAHYFNTVHGETWRSVPVSEIDRMKVQEWVDDLAKDSRSSATRAVNMMSAVINWGVRRGYVKDLHQNPCQGVDRYPIRARERFLHPEEMPRFLDALEYETPLFKDFFLLLLYTGARKGNVLSMKWEDVDLDLKIWSLDNKNGDTHVVALTDESVAILERRQASSTNCYVFPGRGSSSHLKDPKRAWTRIVERAELQKLRIHDLRRTHASYLAIQGESPYIIGRSLGHRDQRSTAVYARLNLVPVREAVGKLHQAWTKPKAAKPNETGPRPVPKVSESARSTADQIMIQGKIIQAIISGGDTKKHFHQKLGGRGVNANSAELESVLNSMIGQKLIRKYFDEGRWIWRYALLEA